MAYLLLIVIAVFIISVYAENRWAPYCIRFGIPVYRKEFAVEPTELLKVEESYLNRVSESFVVILSGPLVLRKIEDGQWYIRQKFWGEPIMHGKLTVETNSTKAHLVGYLSWLSVFIITVVVCLGVVYKEPEALIVILGVLYFFVEKTMYDRLVDHLSQEKKLEQ